MMSKYANINGFKLIRSKENKWHISIDGIAWWPTSKFQEAYASFWFEATLTEQIT